MLRGGDAVPDAVRRSRASASTATRGSRAGAAAVQSAVSRAAVVKVVARRHVSIRSRISPRQQRRPCRRNTSCGDRSLTLGRRCESTISATPRDAQGIASEIAADGAVVDSIYARAARMLKARARSPHLSASMLRRGGEDAVVPVRRWRRRPWNSVSVRRGRWSWCLSWSLVLPGRVGFGVQQVRRLTRSVSVRGAGVTYSVTQYAWAIWASTAP